MDTQIQNKEEKTPGEILRARIAEREKKGKWFTFLITYIYPCLPTVEFFGRISGGKYIGIGFILCILPIFLAIMLSAVNYGMAGPIRRANIITAIFMVLFYFLTAQNIELVTMLLVISLLAVYGIGYYQLLIRKK